MCDEEAYEAFWRRHKQEQEEERLYIESIERKLQLMEM